MRPGPESGSYYQVPSTVAQRSRTTLRCVPEDLPPEGQSGEVLGQVVDNFVCTGVGPCVARFGVRIGASRQEWST